MAVFQEQDPGGYRFVVRSNCALSWRATKLVIWFFALCLAAVAAYFASIGAWLVLPFAGLEFAVIAVGFYWSALVGHTREVIEIKGPVLSVKRGRRQLEEVASFPANWTRVRLMRDPTGWYPSRLILRWQRNGVEVGAKLVEAEREELASSLRDILDFKLTPPDQPDPERIAERLGAPAQAGQGVSAAPDEGGHVVAGTSLTSDGARATGCARGAFTQKREELWQ